MPSMMPAESASACAPTRHTFKDAAETLEKFSGEDPGLPVQSWIEKVSQKAKIYSWTQLDTLLAAEKALKGSAAIWYSYQEGITSWDILKSRIEGQFRKKPLAEIKRILGEKKRKDGQSVVNYIQQVRCLGHRGSVEDDDIREFIAQTVTKDKYLRAILRTATTYEMMEKILQGFDEDSSVGPTPVGPNIQQLALEASKPVKHPSTFDEHDSSYDNSYED